MKGVAWWLEKSLIVCWGGFFSQAVVGFGLRKTKQTILREQECLETYLLPCISWMQGTKNAASWTQTRTPNRNPGGQLVFTVCPSAYFLSTRGRRLPVYTEAKLRRDSRRPCELPVIALWYSRERISNQDNSEKAVAIAPEEAPLWCPSVRRNLIKNEWGSSFGDADACLSVIREWLPHTSSCFMTVLSLLLYMACIPGFLYSLLWAIRVLVCTTLVRTRCWSPFTSNRGGTCDSHMWLKGYMAWNPWICHSCRAQQLKVKRITITLLATGAHHSSGKGAKTAAFPCRSCWSICAEQALMHSIIALQDV